MSILVPHPLDIARIGYGADRRIALSLTKWATTTDAVTEETYEDSNISVCEESTTLIMPGNPFLFLLSLLKPVLLVRVQWTAWSLGGPFLDSFLLPPTRFSISKVIYLCPLSGAGNPRKSDNVRVARYLSQRQLQLGGERRQVGGKCEYGGLTEIGSGKRTHIMGSV